MAEKLTLILSIYDEDNLRKIKSFYAKAAKGRSWQIKIDPSIIGGFIIIDRDKMLDYSVKGQLEEFRRVLLEDLNVAGAKQ